jgi:hypothetical protein
MIKFLQKRKSIFLIFFLLTFFHNNSFSQCETDTTLNISACDFYVFNGTTLSSSGTYTDTLINAASCDSVIILNLTIGSITNPTIIDPLSKIVCNGTLALFSVGVNVPNLNFQWQVRLAGQNQYQNIDVLNTDYLGVNSDTLRILSSNLSMNGAFYRCLISDLCQNYLSNSALLTVNPTLGSPATFELAQAEVCQNDENILYRVSPVAGATAYQWILPNGITANGVSDLRQILLNFSNNAVSGDIIVKAINDCGAGDSIVFSVIVNSNPEADLIIQNETCSADNGSITLSNLSGGSGNFAFLWSNNESGTSISNLNAGNYNVQIFDIVNGCSTDYSSTLVDLISPQISVSGTLSTCGNSNGTATVNTIFSNGPLSYLWSNNQSNATATNLAANFYSVTVSDSNQCTATASINIGNSNGPSIDSTFQFAASCQSNCNGSAGVIVSGGTSPYTYEWNTTPVRTSPTISNLCAGNYIVTVKDANQCAVASLVSVGVSGSNPNISGIITLPNGLLVTNGNVKIELYRVANQIGAFSTLVSETLSNNGLFSLPNTVVGNYLVVAKPVTTSSPDLANSINTYFNLTSKWTKADTLNATCNFTTNFNLTLLQKQSVNGNATITGDVFSVTGGNKRDRAVSVPDADIHVDREPQGIAVTNTTTDGDGRYNIDNLEPGTYRVRVSIPGLPMINSHLVTVTPLGTLYDERNFFIDSLAGIDIDSIADNASSNLQLQEDASWNIFPNPMNDLLYLEIEINDNDTKTQIVLLDILGREINQIYNSDLSVGKHLITYDNSQEFLQKGMYFIRVNKNGISTVKRLIVN